ncbi:MAG: sigma-70 family RNA polymerase sigma factor [Chloroflexi bacterium]|nr:sigma-70 family RNA polymerase sigma factor [Chloroflexota bacterium]
MRKKQETLYSGDESGRPPGDVSAAKREIVLCIEENTDQLLGIIRSYVQRFSLATRDEAPAVALEVLQEVVVEALAHIEKFAGPKQPTAWLLGISINVIRRRKVANARRYSREARLGQPSAWYADSPGEQDILQQSLQPTAESPEQIVEDEEQLKAMLSLVSEEDRTILRLAILDGLRHNELAQSLGTTPTATRARLHRALVRLRTAWQEQHSEQ